MKNRIQKIMIFLTVVSILSLGLNACGYKAPPKPPQESG